MFCKLLFWISAFLVFYTYLGYPVLLLLWSLLKSKKIDKKEFFPHVSVVLPVFNEERNISRRIEDLLAQDYPRDKMELIVIADGCTDGTVHKLCSLENKVKFFALTAHEGKAAALNKGISEAKGEIIIFADARQTFGRGAFKSLVSNFHEARVGAVSGCLSLSNKSNGDIKRPMTLYWNLEEWVRLKESAIDSVIGVTGAIYAIRKDLFTPLPRGTILDDVLIPMRIALKGYRVVMEKGAVAYDVMPLESNIEVRRKIRTLAGNFQLIALFPSLLSPRENRLILQFISHKVLRVLAPYFLIVLFLTNLFLLEGFYKFVSFGQILFYMTALVGFATIKHKKVFKFFSLPYTFLMLNVAAVLGLKSILKKDENVWVR